MAVMNKKGQEPHRTLLRYIEWLEKSIGPVSAPSTRKRMREYDGDERFTFGSKRGLTFRQVAENDPSYHLRCSATGYNPNPDQMYRYREYFDQYGDQYEAAVSEREAIGLAIRICPVDWYGQYDSD